MRPYLKSPPETKTADGAVPTELAHTLVSLLTRESAHSPLARSTSHEIFDDDVIDVKGIAKMLRIGRNKLYEMVARNQIPHRRFGRCIRFSRAAIMRWLDSWTLQDAKERQ